MMCQLLRRGCIVLVVAALAILPAAAATARAAEGHAVLADQATPRLLAKCPGGRLYRLGSQRVLLLAGTPREMGRAHGTLLRDDIRSACQIVLLFARAADIAKTGHLAAGTLEKAYQRAEPFIPPRYQEELQGLAEGSGVPLKTLRLVNIFPEQFHCSGFALFGRAAKGGRLLHGRVLDYITEIGLQNHAVTILARPSGCHTFVNVSYSGFIGSVTGMNDKQVAVGEMGGRGEGLWDGVPMPLLVRKALEEGGTLEQAVDVFRTARRTCEYYYVVSDGKGPDARGLYCTPEEFVALKPGQKHERLTDTVDDAVIFSAGDRLKRLLSQVRKGYGTIDPPAALDLMLRPVAMKGNLHDVLFAPREMEMWVAHASGDLTRPEYQACYQPYEHYDLREWMKLLPAAGEAAAVAAPVSGPAAAPGEPASRPGSATGHAPATQPADRAGRVPVTVWRPMAPCRDPAMAKRLEQFQDAPAAFDWRMTRSGTLGAVAVYDVQFPSPLTSPVECNNTVYAQYFLAPGAGPRPAVIVLHILSDPKFTLERIICYRLACEGVHALLVKMPYYGQRRPADKAKLREMTSDPNNLMDGVRQAVMDVRRSARWLGTLSEVDANRIGLCGVSLGGFVAATAGGIDGYFPRVGVILAGGDLTKVLAGQGREVRGFRQAIEKAGLSDEQVQRLLVPIDPLTYAARLKAADLIMINATNDEIVPADCARRLAEAGGAKLSWYRAGHYSMAMYLPLALEKLAHHFSPGNWPVPPSGPGR
jgi:dienelactone hydrolase